MNPVSLHLPPRGYSSNLLDKYQYYKDTGRYDKVVLVPRHKSQGPMTTNHRPFHRQPTEHPNDRPEPSQSTSSEHPVLYDGMRNMHLQNVYKSPISPTQKVMEWKQEISDNDESFVLDTFSDISTSVGGDIESCSGHHDYHRSVSEQGSSDDDAGLQKSLIGITPPPQGANETSSRPSSNGSQSSVVSNLSFHTVYVSDGFKKPKPKHEEVPAPMRKQNPQTSQSQSQQHQTSGGTVPKLHQTVLTDPYSRPSQPHPETPGTSGQTGVRQINNQASREASTSVFITYAEEQQNPAFKRVVLQLTKTLLSNGIQVRLDMLESTLMSMSVSSWLDDNIQKCDFVIVCVSPSYKAEVAQQDLLETPDPHSLHTRYIYSRLLTEYIQNGSRNYRFIPVLMGGATRRDLPSWFLDTNVYEWPQQYEAIIYRLFRKEKYIQPRVGPPPRCTVEAYGTHDDMTSGSGH